MTKNQYKSVVYFNIVMSFLRKTLFENPAPVEESQVYNTKMKRKKNES